ncbi:Xanthine dehydrogenase/oxidase, partial [Lamellibrachia satsuma]
VLYQGHIIGAVIAETRAHAVRAAKAVVVKYEELTPILTIQQAIDANSFLKSDPTTIKKGDVVEGFKGSDVIIEGEMYVGGQEHFYLETHACIAVPSGEDNEMTLLSSVQHLQAIQNDVAGALGVPSNRIVCKAKRLGGGFGGKETDGTMFALPTAIAANKLQRPVRISLDRDEDMIISGSRHPFLGRYKVGFTKDGLIQALEVDLYSNCGYATDLSPAIMDRAVLHVENSYKIPNVTVRGHLCKMNLPSNTAFRGFGAPQSFLICENWMDQAAQKLNISCDKLRKKNLYTEGDLTHYNQPLTNCNMSRCWEDVMRQSNYERQQDDINVFNSENRWKKRGIAVIPVKFGIAFTVPFLNQGGALLHVYTDGSVLLAHGGVEMGQGLHTKMIQVASRALKIPMSHIHISESSTNTVPNASPSAASSTSDLNGMAILHACETILQRLEPYKEKNPSGSWVDWVNAAYMDRVSLSTTGFYKTPDVGKYDWKTNAGQLFNYFSYGVAVSEVEIDTLTGDHTVLRTDIVMDIGRSLNPAIDIGQIEGGFLQGYGLFMLEEERRSMAGALYTCGPGTYKIPGFGDIPVQLNVTLLKGASNPRAVYSSKAIGEPPLFLAASVFFAIRHAIAAARADVGLNNFFQLNSPATAEKIRMACADQFTKQFPEPKKGSYTPWVVGL